MNHGSKLLFNEKVNDAERRFIMPRGDRTGPEGKGPKTGRGLGKSQGNESGQNIGRPRRQHNYDRNRGNGHGLGQHKNR